MSIQEEVFNPDTGALTNPDTGEILGRFVDPDTGAIFNPDTGEIVGYEDMPDDDPEEIADYLSERLLKATARLNGLRAERQTHLDRIADIYDPLIRTAEQSVTWLRTNPSWLEILRGWAAEKLVGAKTKTLKHGLLKLSFRSSRESIEVVNEADAIDWADSFCPEAVKVTTSLLKSAIPEEMRRDLPDNCGLVYHPKGETETFEVE